ncbi:pirin family protein [Emticicia sp. ODNR4P]|nr:pirin family protein [Emticicia sp. ODNR4P]
MRNIKQIHQPHYAPIRDLVTYGVIPTRTLDYLDPFLFLNHHGYQVYPKNNQGLPFGPHPHRGMETVTFILDGDIKHQDSTGHSSVMKQGGVQWMTAGKGLIHAETSSEEFMKEGGPLEILQLWINLPASHKMMEPQYNGLDKEDIPTITKDGVLVQVLSGNVAGVQGPFESVTGVTFTTVSCAAGSTWSMDIPAEDTIFFYVVRGSVRLNGRSIEKRNLVEFDYQEGMVSFDAIEDSYILLGHCKPLDEPVVSQGPFVMNTEEEIYQAYSDYQRGLFGRWNF